MATVIEKPARTGPVASQSARTGAADDGTAQLLRWGGWTIAAGVLFALLTKFVLGGIGEHGPHTSAGWLALIVTMMCLPFGCMLFLLGAAKWLRNRRMRQGL
jgi:drug/metabolite transporter (DMT)-like permease